jgi:hypothetical protein
VVVAVIDKFYAGAAVKTTVVGSMSPTVPGAGQTFTLADATGWPGGAGGQNFVLRNSVELSNEEAILCSRVGTTCTVVQRGYDGTTPQTHSAGSPCEHRLDAATMTSLRNHVDGLEANPHDGVLLDNTDHDVQARHTYGSPGAYGPGTALPVTLTPDAGNSAGTGATPARSDHRHDVPAGSAQTITGTNAEGVGAAFVRTDHNHQIGGTNHIPAAALVNKSLAAAQIADGTIVNGSLLGTGQKLYYSQAGDPGAVGADLLWWNTTTRCLLVRNAGNTAWEVIGGTGAWQSYDPAVFNITHGNGVKFGRYIRIGRIVVGNLFYYVGTTTVFGANIGFGIPFNAADLDSFVGYPGVATNEFFSHGASRGSITSGVFAAVGVVAQAGASKAVDRVNFFATAGSAAWGAGVPGAWGAGNRLSVFFEYETADAQDPNYD